MQVEDVVRNVKTVSEILAVLAKHRVRGQRIVFTNGCFDIVHVGHIMSLAFARRQGDVLVVGLNSDRSVRRLREAGRPIFPEQERACLLAALEYVSYVVIFDEDTPIDLIKKIRPDVLVKGEDWRDKKVVGQDFVESYGGRMVFSPLINERSTTDIIFHILRCCSGRGSE